MNRHRFGRAVSSEDGPPAQPLARQQRRPSARPSAKRQPRLPPTRSATTELAGEQTTLGVPDGRRRRRQRRVGDSTTWTRRGCRATTRRRSLTGAPTAAILQKDVGACSRPRMAAITVPTVTSPKNVPNGRRVLDQAWFARRRPLAIHGLSHAAGLCRAARRWSTRCRRTGRGRRFLPVLVGPPQRIGRRTARS